ncbi:YggS family pyridoxal phosphate-dependent enzyme [Metabacillus idriensis]|uniref:YggS family pyridoxal phosphate-dependent enzyme n=1 Tax=Metabacillus idriensis TaxID=324768 RepID=UPI002812FAC2|nr:YggS family pyridoxal phosphate-dependent enzyme [Metabacillus idriensis]MDR0137279.1 YggS family pyridoxal phosphate-dependent enzyme [Metabacillus idriensis]
MSVADNLNEIYARIENTCSKIGRNPNEIQIIAVTKYVDINRAKEALSAGISHLGENRNEGLNEKYTAIGSEAKWHFIGTLQTRKVKDIIGKADYIHSLDRLSLVKEISKRADNKIDCFIQVNTSGEESKHGMAPDEVLPFVKELESFPYINVAGLMTMAPHTDDTGVLRQSFRRLRELGEEVRALQLPYAPCKELSMGMSNDFEIAIEEGATFIRIGSALVG